MAPRSSIQRSHARSGAKICGTDPSTIARMEPIPVDLSGVPETLLWNLGRRAAAARPGVSLLEDPLAIEVVGRLQYDFTDASRGARWHAVRVATFDAAVRRFLNQH